MIQDLLLDIWALVNEMSPYLLLGFLLAGLMHAFIPAEVYSAYLSRDNFRSVWLAALFGVPLPLCSCGVLPTAMGLRREGASRGATVAFLISTPQTGVDSIAATYSLMGLPFAILRPVVAFLTALAGGTMVNWGLANNGGERRVESEERRVKSEERRVKSEERRVKSEERRVKSEEYKLLNPSDTNSNSSLFTLHSSLSTLHQRLLSALHYAFVEMVGDIGKWLVVGLVVAGMITALVPDACFSAFRDNSLLSILLVLSISVPMYVCATGSIPIAVALMMKGLTPGAALVLLMAGPACNVASLLVINKVMGRRTLLLYLSAIVGGAVLSGLGIDYLLPRQWFTSSLLMQDGCCHEGGIGWFSILSTVALALMLANALFHPHHHNHGGTAPTTESREGEASPTLHSPLSTLHIRGMHCSHCARNVEQAIRSVPGVEDVSVSLSEGSATVVGRFDTDAVRQAVESIGYEIK